MSKIKLAVIDDHALFRRGLVSLLSEMEDFVVCGEASNGKESITLVESTHPDIVLMDVNMPIMDGIQALEAIRDVRKDQKVIMLTISQSDEDLVRAIAAGANGYLLKNAEPEHLRNTIIEVMRGNSVLAPEMTEKVFASLRRAQIGQRQTLLSDREVEVLNCMVKGLTTHQMAELMFISDNTVKTHIRHILEKLQANNRDILFLEGDLSSGKDGGVLTIKDSRFLENMARSSNQALDLVVESFKNYRYNTGVVSLGLENNNVVFLIDLEGSAGKRSLKIIWHDFNLRRGK